jgi:hypothetical protein
MWISGPPSAPATWSDGAPDWRLCLVIEVLSTA